MNFKNLVQQFVEIIVGILVPLVISLGVIYFLYGVLKYLISAGDESKRKESVKVITYGLVAIFVMVTVWGLVSILTSTFGIRVGIPQFPVM